MLITLQYIIWLPLIHHINFVGNENSCNITTSLLSHILQPLLNILKRLLGCHIINQYSSVRVPNIRGNERSESLLSCGVPQLKSHRLAIHRNAFRQKIYSNSWLRLISHIYLMVGWYLFIDKSLDYGCLSYGLITNENYLKFGVCLNFGYLLLHLIKNY